MKNLFLNLLIVLAAFSPAAQAATESPRFTHFAVINDGMIESDSGGITRNLEKSLEAQFGKDIYVSRGYSNNYKPDSYLTIAVESSPRRDDLIHVVKKVKGFEKARVFDVAHLQELYALAWSLSKPTGEEVARSVPSALLSENQLLARMNRVVPALLATAGGNDAWVSSLSNSQLLLLTTTLVNDLEPVADLVYLMEGGQRPYSNLARGEFAANPETRKRLKEILSAGTDIALSLSREVTERIVKSTEFNAPLTTAMLYVQMLLDAPGAKAIQSVAKMANMPRSRYASRLTRWFERNLEEVLTTIKTEGATLKGPVTFRDGNEVKDIQTLMAYETPSGRALARFHDAKGYYSLAKLWMVATPNIPRSRFNFEAIDDSVMSYLNKSIPVLRRVQVILEEQARARGEKSAQEFLADESVRSRITDVQAFREEMIHREVVEARRYPMLHAPAYHLLYAVAYETGLAEPGSRTEKNGLRILDKFVKWVAGSVVLGEGHPVVLSQAVLKNGQILEMAKRKPELDKLVQAVDHIAKVQAESCDAKLR